MLSCWRYFQRLTENCFHGFFSVDSLVTTLYLTAYIYFIVLEVRGSLSMRGMAAPSQTFFAFLVDGSREGRILIPASIVTVSGINRPKA